MPNDGAILTVWPVSIWKRHVGLDFKKFVTGLGKAALSAKTGQFEAASKSLLDSVAALRLKNPSAPEAAALLIGRSLQRSVVQLVNEVRPLLLPGLESSQAVKELDIRLEDHEVGIDRKCLERPRFALVDSVGEQLRVWLIGAGIAEDDAGRLAGRLPEVFVTRFHDEWAKRPETYAVIEVYLDLPPAKERGRQHAWALSDAQLRHQLDEKVLGQPFTLRDTFVPLRAYWKEPRETIGLERDEVRTTKLPRHHVVELAGELTSWVENGDPEDAVRMLRGGPGSGKSTAAKMFAAEMTERDNLRVVWVPLHRLSFSTDLPRALSDYCRERFTPLEDFLESTDKAILLIFDGLDELAMSGRASQEIAKAFVSDVIRLVDRHNSSNSRKLLVLLSGRDVAVQEYAAELRHSRVLHLLGHFPDPAISHEFEPESLYREDRRDLWWTARHRVTGEGSAVLPQELRGDALRDLTSQPLLTVLLSIIEKKLGGLDLKTPWALNEIYETLLSDVYRRQWGSSHHTHRKLEKAEYLRLLEEIAVGAWHSGESRHISWQQIWQRCETAHLTEALKRFSKEAQEGVTQLLTAFYFRKTSRFDDQGERTFEFTHKSFAEYLVARNVAELIEACRDNAADHRKNVRRGRSTRDLLVDWAALMGPEIMEDNLADLVRGEILKRDEGSLPDLHATLEAMLREAVHRGYPMEHLGLSTFPEMMRQAQNAEVALAICTAGAARAAKTTTQVDWPDIRAAAGWIYRLSNGTPWESLLSRRGLSRLVLSGADLVSLALNEADLSGTDLSNALLEGAIFQGSNLSNANFSGAELYRAYVSGCDLSGASLDLAQIPLVEFVDPAIDSNTSFRET